VAVFAAVAEPALARRELGRKHARLAQAERVVDGAELAVLVLAAQFLFAVAAVVFGVSVAAAVAGAIAVAVVAAAAVSVVVGLGILVAAAFGGVVVECAAGVGGGGRLLDEVSARSVGEEGCGEGGQTRVHPLGLDGGHAPSARGGAGSLLRGVSRHGDVGGGGGGGGVRRSIQPRALRRPLVGIALVAARGGWFHIHHGGWGY
jgi:hypothetical protein